MNSTGSSFVDSEVRSIRELFRVGSATEQILYVCGEVVDETALDGSDSIVGGRLLVIEATVFGGAGFEWCGVW
jgi:hypothetical protein